MAIKVPDMMSKDCQQIPQPPVSLETLSPLSSSYTGSTRNARITAYEARCVCV